MYSLRSCAPTSRPLAAERPSTVSVSVRVAAVLAILVSIPKLVDAQGTTQAVVQSSETEAKMGPITSILKMRMVLDGGTAADDGIDIGVELYGLPRSRIRGVLGDAAPALYGGLAAGGHPLFAMASAFNDWAIVHFADTDDRNGVDIALGWNVALRIPIQEMRASGTIGDGREAILDALPIIFEGAELTFRYATFIGSDDGAFGGVVSGVLPDVTEGELPAVEFLGTDSLRLITQIYNGLVDLPGEQAGFVEEILAQGIVAELVGKIAAGGGAFSELGLEPGFPLPPGTIRASDIVRIADASERLYLCSVAFAEDTVTGDFVLRRCLIPWMEQQASSP